MLSGEARGPAGLAAALRGIGTGALEALWAQPEPPSAVMAPVAAVVAATAPVMAA